MARPKADYPAHAHDRTTDRGFVRLSGVRTYTGKWGTREAEDKYKRLLAEWIQRGRQPEHVANPTAPDPITGTAVTSGEAMTIAQLVAAYWIHCRKRYAKWIIIDAEGRERVTGELDNIRQALKPLTRLYGSTPGAKFGPRKLAALRTHMIGAGRCRNYINRVACRVVAVFAWGVTAELVTAMAHHALTTLLPLDEGEEGVRESEPVGSVEDARVDAVLNLLPGPVRALVELQAVTGARGDELRRLRTRDVDRSNPKAWEYRPRRHKTSHKKKGRFIPFGPQAQGILRPYLKLNPDAYCFSPADAVEERRAKRAEKRKTPLSCGNVAGSNVKANPKRQPKPFYTQHAYRRCIARACEVAFKMPKDLRKRTPLPAIQTPEAIEEWKQREADRRAAASAWRKANVWKPHQLRHSVINKLRRLYGEEVASLVAGHAKLDTTALYGERNEARVREVAEAVG